jgi:hypothetical protein
MSVSASAVRASLVALVLPSVPLLAQAHDHAGSPEGMVGRVHFESHCRADSRPVLERGVALLHSFWYEAAATTFEQAARRDSTCAFAYWGQAMSQLHPLWTPPTPPERQVALAAAATAVRLSRPGSRERDYANAIATMFQVLASKGFRDGIFAWESAMAVVETRHPRDDEARIFHGLALIAAGQQDPGDTTYRRQREAAARLSPLVDKYPDHPGLAHYLIHAFDSPALASLAKPAADKYAQIAPDVPHALHMPSHIYVRLGLWRDAVASNRRSADAATSMERAQHWNGAWGQRLHAWDYLAYAELQLGDDSAARALVEEADQVTVTIPANDLVGDYALAAIPARYVLERDDWVAATTLRVRPSPSWPATEALTHFARALGAARSGDSSLAVRELATLATLRDSLTRMGGPQSYWSGQVEIQRLAAGAWLSLLQGDTAAALSAARDAADREDRTEKHPVTPGQLVPARELYADLLLSAHRPTEALQAYRAVEARQPHRARTLRGLERARFASGSD